MKSLFGVFLVLSILGSAASSADTTTVYGDAVSGNIGEGHWNVGGSVYFIKQSGRGSNPTSFSLSSSAKYFVIDRLAMGGAWALESETGSTTYSTLGPSFAYYFWAAGNLASHLGLDVRFGLTDNAYPSVYQGTWALDVFLLPSVAISPALFFSRYNDTYSSMNRYGMTATFGIYI